ncbi:MAG: hypothetical protein K8R59_06020 [Thermoanaerobaculales bacterium]|nr:hypothetical protein [Thermoanaerobaculales bacterium]
MMTFRTLKILPAVVTALVLALYGLNTPPVMAQDCPEFLGRWAYGRSYAVGVAGDYAYFGTGAFLQVVDISRPENSRVVGEVMLPTPPVGIVVSDGFAFVAAGRSGLRVIDVSSPDSPTEIGSYDGLESVLRVAVSGGHAYVVDGDRGLWILDVGTPSSPEEVGFFETPGSAQDVCVKDGIAYVADRDGGLRLIDVSKPDSPTEIGFFDTPGDARKVSLWDGHAIVWDHDGVLWVIDVSTPAEPVEVGSFDTNARIHDMSSFRAHVYLACDVSGLRVVDISDPESPVEVESIATPGRAYGVAVSDYVAFVADYDQGLRVIRIPRYTDSSEVAFIPVKGFFSSVALSEGYAFAADRDGVLRVIDIRTPESMTEVASFEVDGELYDLVISGDLLYASDPLAGFRVFDISDPMSPAEIGFLEIEGGVNGLAVKGDFVYAAAWENGLSVIDVSSPIVPRVVGSYDAAWRGLNVAVSGDYAYVAARSGGLRIIDISDPTTPEEVGFYIDDSPWGFQWTAFDVAARGKYAYVTSDSFGPGIFDVSDPAEPTWEEWWSGDGGLAVALSEDHLYIGEYSGLAAYDLSIPNAPGFAGKIPAEGFITRITITGSIVAGVRYGGGLSLFRTCPEGSGRCTPIYVAAAASGAGEGGSEWATDLTVNSSGEEGLRYRLQFLPRGADNTAAEYTMEIPLIADRTRNYRDIWRRFSNTEGVGSINVCVSDPDAAIVTSRTYATTEEGTYGQSIDGVKADSGKIITEGETARLGFLTENDAFRTNVGFMNTGAAPITVAAEFFRADGVSLGVSAIELAPYSNDQWNRAFRRVTDDKIDLAYVDVRSDTEGAAFLAYASVIDNGTDDPATIWPFDTSAAVGGGAFDCTPVWIAAALSGDGDGETRWATDLNVTNLGAEMLGYRFQLLPRDEDNSDAPMSDLFTLAGQASVTYADAWESLSGQEGGGAINVCVDNADAAGIVSRSYNTGDEGTFGQTIVGMRGAAPAKVGTGEKVRLVGLAENEDFRTNIGFLNAGSVSITVNAEFFVYWGQSLGTKSVELLPYSSIQWNRAFTLDPINSLSTYPTFVEVWSDTEDAAFLVYASVVDNGTGDPTTVWPF